MVPGIRIRNAGTLFLDDLGLTEIGGGPTTQTLTVSKGGTGAGTVTSSPARHQLWRRRARRRSPRARA